MELDKKMYPAPFWVVLLLLPGVTAGCDNMDGSAVKSGTTGKVEWVTVENGVITAETETEPMTSAAQRIEADALAVVPDDAEL